jgi:hypothetical protein
MVATTREQRSDTAERVEVPLDGAVEADVHISFGGGQLALGKAKPGMLVEGDCWGGAVVRRTGPGHVAIEPSMPVAIRRWRPLSWELGITSEIPVVLTLDTGGNRASIDLGSLRVRRCAVNTGASETSLLLPAEGSSVVRIACGFASVHVKVPAKVAARIRGRMTLGSTVVDATRFPRTADGWQSPGFEDSIDRVDIEVEGGFGSIDIG